MFRPMISYRGKIYLGPYDCSVATPSTKLIGKVVKSYSSVHHSVDPAQGDFISNYLAPVDSDVYKTDDGNLLVKHHKDCVLFSLDPD